MENIKREIQDAIQQRMAPQKVMLIYGARRVGKTILIKQIYNAFEGRKIFLNGEDHDVVTLLENQSISNYKHLFEQTQLLVIDEAQHIPDIGNKLKLMVDEIDNLQIIASGSSSFDLKNDAGNPLVGRGTSFLLTPFSQKELARAENPIETMQKIEERLIYGTYPDVTKLTTFEAKKEYLQDIVDAYLLKDILAIDGIKNTSKMYDLLRLIAYQQGNMVSYDEIGKQLSMNRNTVERYLDLLQKVFVIYRLTGFARNMRKEIAKAGKFYFYDNGIRNAVIRNFQPLSLRSDADRGSLWENYIITEKLKHKYNHHLLSSFYFWRTYDNQEIDLIEEQENKISAYEIKSNKKEVKVPRGFAKAYPDASFTHINRENYLQHIML